MPTVKDNGVVQLRCKAQQKSKSSKQFKSKKTKDIITQTDRIKYEKDKAITIL